MTPLSDPFRLPATAADTSRWLPIVCPICHLLARALPAGQDAMAIDCESCGPHRLTCAAERIFGAEPCPVDREQLSEAVQDTCLMAECDWPLIDSLTAGALVGLAGLAPAARPFRPSASFGAAAP